MAYRQETDQVAKWTRSIIDDVGRRYKNSTLGDIYISKPNLKEMYTKWHFNIITDFPFGDEMQNMIDILLLLFLNDINIDECDAWLLYYGHMSTLLAKKIGGLTNISKVAFMEQEKKEENIGDASEWLLFERDNSS